MNIVPTPATARIAKLAIADARRKSSGDSVLRWLPEVDPDQQPAFLGLVLKVAATTPARFIEKAIRQGAACLDCGGGRDVQSSRGLCKPCYDHHRYAGTLEEFPLTTRPRSERIRLVREAS